jgi:enamine deaminase RidA (YjgF/YER057c/UK114 family)
MSLEPVQPAAWTAPRGYSNGVLAPAGARTLFVAGQIAWDARQRLVGAGDFVAQFAQALANVVEVVRAAGGGPEHVARLTIYVTDKRSYLTSSKELGAAYRGVMGRHFPAMSLVEVAALLEPGALVEIEGTAAIVGEAP